MPKYKHLTNEEKEERRQRQRQRAKVGRAKQVQAQRAWLIEYKTSRGCRECGETHPACLDLHHRDPLDKIEDISRMVQRGLSMRHLEKEVKKCDVLCANCHRKLHWSK